MQVYLHTVYTQTHDNVYIFCIYGGVGVQKILTCVQCTGEDCGVLIGMLAADTHRTVVVAQPEIIEEIGNSDAVTWVHGMHHFAVAEIH